MRISDWSSDVCSSDLHRPQARRHAAAAARRARGKEPRSTDMNLMHKTLLAAAVCALLPAAALAKDVVMPRDLPAYGADKPLPVPDIEKKTLANGLEVWVLPRDGVPRVDYVLAVRGAGSPPAAIGRAACKERVGHTG